MRGGVIPIRTLGDSVVGLLREHILAGTFTPGARLSDIVVSEYFEVSRATARSALKQVCHEGLVINIPNRGFFVTEIDTAEILDLLTSRALLESEAAASAASKLTSVEFDILEGCIDQISSVDYEKEIGRVREVDIVFHRTIAEASQRPILIELWASLNSRISLMERVCRDLLKLTSSSSVQRHRNYLEALRTGRSEAAADAAREHYYFYVRLLTEGRREGGASDEELLRRLTGAGSTVDAGT